MKKIVTYIVLIVGTCSCEVSEDYAESIEQVAVVQNSKICPPIVNQSPIAEFFQINNSIDTILISSKGNYISIPKNCFIDINGEDVKGNISISFTEYLSTSDILLSGIPMVYMEGNDTLNFQSAGMCEVLASSGKRILSLKDNKQIEIGLRSLAQDNDYNLYYFDTLSGEWLEKEKSLAVVLADQLPIVPVGLHKVDTNTILEIKIENYKVRPLYRMWHRSKFCIYGENKLISSDSSIWWYDMTINPTKNRDLYDLTFNGVDEDRRQYVYNLMVQPGIDSVNYAKEFEYFQENMRAYVKELQVFKSKLNLNTVNSLKIQDEFAQIKKEEEVRNVIQLREDSMSMVEYLLGDSLRQVQQLINDSLQVIQNELWEKQKTDRYKSNRTRIEVMRSFQISQMGIFNCDRFYLRPIVATKKLNMFVDSRARQFDSAYLVDVNSNAVLKYLKYSVRSYVIDLDLTPYVFIGILGGEIYMANLSIYELTERFNSVIMKKIELSELKEILN